MAKQYVTQEVYDALKGITSDKNEYEYLKSVGATEDAEGYRKAAMPKYSLLMNYDRNIANNISGMNSVQAKDYLNNFAVARDEKAILGDISLGKYGWSNSTTDADRNKFQANTAPFYDELAAVNPQLADVVRGWDYGQLNSYITTGQMPEIKKPAAAVNAAADGSNAQVTKPAETKTSEQIATGNNTFLTAQGQRGLDTIYDMYTNPGFGQEIRDMFTAYGGAMGNRAAAGAAAENGGNLDSFAEFNKNATDLGYRLAGENAIQNKRSGFATDYFTKGYDSVANALNTNAVDYYDYVLGQNQIYSDEKKAQWEKEANMYGYDVDKYIADREAEATMAEIEASKGAAWNEYVADMAQKGFNPDGTLKNVATSASGLSGLVINPSGTSANAKNATENKKGNTAKSGGGGSNLNNIFSKDYSENVTSGGDNGLTLTGSEYEGFKDIQTAEEHIALQENAGMNKKDAVLQAANMLVKGGKPDLAKKLCDMYGVEIPSYDEWENSK